MAASEPFDVQLRLAARRAYERGRWTGAFWRGAVAAGLVMPGFLMCNETPLAAICLVGFGLVVAAGRFRGQGFEEGARAGALAGILPCLLPVTVRAIDPDLCAMISSRGPWLCAIGGAAAGVILLLRPHRSGGLPFWSSALAALAFAAAIGCIPSGAMGFAGLAFGMMAGGAPVIVARKAFV